MVSSAMEDTRVVDFLDRRELDLSAAVRGERLILITATGQVMRGETSSSVPQDAVDN